MATRYFTPLRYPGGKSKLSSLVSSLILHNELEGGHYAEPYAGGAAVALELLAKDVVTHVHINDLNRGVYCFWDSLLNNTEQLMGKIYECPLTMSTWHAQRFIMTNHQSYNNLDIGFAFFFLNRTNRSGIINAGVIGGYDQTGNYKIDARFNKDELIERITNIAKRKNSISLYNLDAEKFLITMDKSKNKKIFTYIDPPYFVKGKRLYDNFYQEHDHARIRDLIKILKNPWLLSYDDHIEIRRLYSKFRACEIDLVYSAASKTKGQEILYFSQNLAIPAALALA